MGREANAAEFDQRVHDALAHPPVLVPQHAHQLWPELLIGIGDCADDLRRHPAYVDVAAAQQPDHRPRDVELALHRELLENFGGAVSHRDLVVGEGVDQRRQHGVGADGLQRSEHREADDARAGAHLPLQRGHHAGGAEAAQSVDRRLDHSHRVGVEEDAHVLEPVILSGEGREGEDGLDDDRLLLLLRVEQRRDGLEGSGRVLHRGVAEVLERVYLFRRRAGDERRLQGGDRLLLGEAYQDVHRFDAACETRLGHRAAEQIEQRAAAAELLQGTRDGGAQPAIGRAQVVDQHRVLGRAVHLGQQRGERGSQRRLRRLQRLHERRAERLVRVLVDQAREHRQPRALHARVRRFSRDDVQQFQELRGLRRFRFRDESLHLVGGPPRRSLELVEEVLPRDHRRSPA